MMSVKILLRTLQVNFPYLEDAKFAGMRIFRNLLKVPFEKDFNALSLFPDTDGALYLDVGANRGQSTDAILMMTRKSRIQMFEPNPLLGDRLEKRFSENDRVTVYHFGAGDIDSKEKFYLPFSVVSG
jgi:hypothetical protein